MNSYITRALPETFVFLDLETTDLIRRSKIPEIIEISMLAVSRGALKSSDKSELPRVIHKLSVPLRPRNKIQPRAAEITSKYIRILHSLLLKYNIIIYHKISSVYIFYINFLCLSGF